ncbi:DUF2809 domain-containing protein [Hymenobacter sp. H14-R3]|uniref:ribosomal maturation YjgA family protein n=1 Tax=Hymenobacter sp. H14-R3 TaxID=3046308 RepID=UPI0024B9BADC|nr:DUF2809 domain-containing protein [Hymenobacter sp. H14-R3]MDJ0365800.1 DUF2809 domain-containing protein [Hymenobacter sp. H14-R3]
MLGFNKGYLGCAALLLGLEIFIGTFVNDQLVRPYVGDFLVTILLYCLVRGLCQLPGGRVLGGVLLFSYLVETGQYFHLVDRLGLGQWRVVRIVLGTSFAWADMLAYTLGALLVLAVERGFRTTPTGAALG